MSDTFPRQYARARRFTLGEPRDLTVDETGTTVVFARSKAGDDPVNCLWVADVATGDETLVADPRELLARIAADDADLPPEERARRERMREGAGGVTAYALDDAGALAAFALAGQLFVADVPRRAAHHVPVEGPVFDPRPDPTGSRVAYVRGRALWVTDLAGSATAVAAEPAPAAGRATDATVSWGSADFVAAEEMGRHRGYWWSPDGSTLAVCRVDETPVQVWHISDPADPGTPPATIRYPAAGTANADVTLHLCPVDTSPVDTPAVDAPAVDTVSGDGPRPVAVRWDRAGFPYLAQVNWTPAGLTIAVQSRDQRDLRVLQVDPRTGATTELWADHDARWVDLVPGANRLVADGVLVTCADRDGARRLLVGGEPVSPPDVQVRAIVAASAARVIATGNPLDDATVAHVYRWSNAGFEALTSGPSVDGAAAGGDVVVIRTSDLDRPGGTWRLPSGAALASHAETPLVRPSITIHRHTAEHPAIAVLLPTDHDGSSLPVLLDPYGGPHAQRVVRSYNAHCASQWFADQGFAVVVVDGRGTPGRGTGFERAVHHDLATGVLDDQIAGLHAAAELHPALDLERVAIRGWSFGGYLAALAVLRRPDVFHAAVAGAPVTEWRLYDTHYTERYLGDPNTRPDVYDANSLLPLADRLERPLLLVHGLSDDNVVAAHTLRLSGALLAAGKPHEVLPLVGVTHMPNQEVVAENLLLHQLAFLRRSLGLTTVGRR